MCVRYQLDTNLMDCCDRWCWSHMSDQRIVEWLIASFGCVSSCYLLRKYSTGCSDRNCSFVHCLGVWSVDLKLFTGWNWWRYGSI